MFWPFDPTPGTKGVCKDRICACVVLYAPSPLIWYATGLLSLSHMVSWVRCGTWFYQILIFAFFLTLTFWPHPRDSRLCVRTEYGVGSKGKSKEESIEQYMLHGSLCLLPFNLICNMTSFRKKMFWTIQFLPRLWAKYLLPYCCMSRSFYFEMQHGHIL